MSRESAAVICCGFDGLEITPALADYLKRVPLAGLVLFSRNVATLAQLRALTDRIREQLDQPIIAVDQEGGRVARLRDGVEALPPMLSLGATGDAQLAARAGEQLGFDLRRAGINLDFAPVLDLLRYDGNTVIGARAFGDEPAQVVNLAGSLARGLERSGVVATYKHFPGHGSTPDDSHTNLPVSELPESTLRDDDIRPFAELLPQARAVMTAHVVLRAFDDAPATMSGRLLTHVLREEIGFRGVCFTDCLQMDAVARYMGSTQAAVRALCAGADCVLISHSLELAEQCANAIDAALRSGELGRKRFEEAVSRLAELRRELQEPLPLNAAPPHAGVGMQIGRRAITLFRGEPGADPANSAIVSFEGETTEGAQGRHSEHPSPGENWNVPVLRVPLNPTEAQVTNALASLSESGRRAIVLMRRAGDHPAQQHAIQQIIACQPDALIVSVREPFDGLACTPARHVLLSYGDDRPSIAGLDAVMFAGCEPEGRLPLHSAIHF